jgi:hypothetical protein
MSPLTVAHLAAQTDYAAAQFMKGTMINTRSLLGFIKRDETGQR